MKNYTLRRSLPLLALALIVIPSWMPQSGLAETETPIGYPMTSYMRCTREPAILNALHAMDQTAASRESLRWIVDQPVRVVFKDMKLLSKGLENYDALSWISGQGEQVILVNEKHRNAPPEALAAMLSHEALHNDPFNSISEEIAGWRAEALVWTEIKKLNPALSQIPTGMLPLVDRENRIEKEYDKGNLEAFVKGNAGYRNLPESSPGFNPPARTANANR